MKRVLAVVLIAALTTLIIGVDRPSWAAQGGDQKNGEKQRAAVTKALREMGRGTTASVERKNGEKYDVVIEAISDETVTVLRQHGQQAVSESIPIADIAKIKKTSPKKMGVASTILITAAVTLGVLVVAGLAACASAASSGEPTATSH